ncbi:MAG: ATP-dependent helicase [Microbacteriaceae bacterium]|nr:ATP-dependent helicase [Microbacteriaceae bacterium]
MSEPTSDFKFNAEKINEIIGLKYPPTTEQKAIIESPLEPSLVVAGAGSGKTETMASRVVWLVANGYAKPNEILGLTFTRKAASELQQRVRQRLKSLTNSLGSAEIDPLELPQISTYNSFANRLIKIYGPEIGIDPNTPLISETTAWMIARKVVINSKDPRIAEMGRVVDTVADAILKLAGAATDHGVEPEKIRVVGSKYASLFPVDIFETVDLKAEKVSAGIVKHGRTLATLEVLAPLVDDFYAEKRRLGVIDIGDQVALATKIVQMRPAVREQLRATYKTVLLDEYQDTSVSQTRLFSEIFGEMPVMAVGDPNQAIYGWRGASASNLANFPKAFSPSGEVKEYSLSTSWRNGVNILNAANIVVAEIAHQTASIKKPLKLTSSQNASSFNLVWRDGFTIFDEAKSIAAEITRYQESHPNATIAMLFRAKTKTNIFTRALAEAGIKYHIVGVAGLLEQPEVIDLISAAKIIATPEKAGSDLLRLLVGARWRMGLADLRKLNDFARWVHKYDYSAGYTKEQLEKIIDSQFKSQDRFSNLSMPAALDALRRLGKDHKMVTRIGFSEVGLERLIDAANLFHELRSLLHLDTADLLWQIAVALDLDIETIANEKNLTGMRNVDEILSLVNDYQQAMPDASLQSFLRWVEAAAKKEKLEPAQVDPEPGTVQIMTIHAAKGLEWDFVVVPQMLKETFPNSNSLSGHEVQFGSLPAHLRSDSQFIPSLNPHEISDREDFVQAIDKYLDRAKRHLNIEELRLFYVAITRARHVLMLTACVWATGGPRPKHVSELISLISRSMQIGPRPSTKEYPIGGVLPAPISDPYKFAPAQKYEEIVAQMVSTYLEGDGPNPEALENLGTGTSINPLAGELVETVWPGDPLGWRRPVVKQVASESFSAVVKPTDYDKKLVAGLLAEERNDQLKIPLPFRIPASKFKDYVTDSNEVAAQIAFPVPQRPYRATAMGTIFHTWVENRSVGRLDEELEYFGLLEDDIDFDFDDEELSDSETSAENYSNKLSNWQDNFAKSKWGSRQPWQVELEIHLPIAEQIIICKIDAIFKEGEKYEIVDWKTGALPKDAADKEAKDFQLSLYRLALAKYLGVPIEDISACFYFVKHDKVLEASRLLSEEEVAETWQKSVLEQLG